MCCPLVFEFSVGIGGFVIGLGQISFFFSLKIMIILYADYTVSMAETKDDLQYQLNCFQRYCGEWKLHVNTE